LRTVFVHFAELESGLDDGERDVLDRLLRYGPKAEEGLGAGVGVESFFLVVPRPGTISPWSSKATDIARNCGLGKVRRLERGIAYTLVSGEPLDRPTMAALLHD